MNVITTGSGNDSIDGGGGADIIDAGGGNDTVSYRSTEFSIDGGAGNNTLLLRAATTVDLTNVDQTMGDVVTVAGFQNVDASQLVTGVSITGSSGVNVLTGGTGNDTIDGNGGADVIAAGSGSDTVTYRGTEASIDGGLGSDTLVMAVDGGTTAVNFAVAAGADQTVGDVVGVSNFENLDATALSTALSVTGSASANVISTGSGNDTIDGGGGADIIAAGVGNDSVVYRGAEVSIDGGAGTNTLVMTVSTTVNLGNIDQTTGDVTAVTNFQNVDASALSAATSITGSSGVNILTGGSGGDTIDGGGGADVIDAGAGDDTVSYRGTETTIDGSGGNNTLLLRAAATINLANADQSSADSTNVLNFANVDASLLSSGVSITGYCGRQHPDRWIGQRYDRRRWRRRHDRLGCRRRYRHLSRHRAVDRRRQRIGYPRSDHLRRHDLGQLRRGRGNRPDDGRYGLRLEFREHRRQRAVDGAERAGIRGCEYHPDRLGRGYHRWRWRRRHHRRRRRQRHRRLLRRRDVDRRRRRHQLAHPAGRRYGQSRQRRSDVGRYHHGRELPERGRVVACDRRSR